MKPEDNVYIPLGDHVLKLLKPLAAKMVMVELDPDAKVDIFRRIDEIASAAEDDAKMIRESSEESGAARMFDVSFDDIKDFQLDIYRSKNKERLDSKELEDFKNAYLLNMEYDHGRELLLYFTKGQDAKQVYDILKNQYGTIQAADFYERDHSLTGDTGLTANADPYLEEFGKATPFHPSQKDTSFYRITISNLSGIDDWVENVAPHAAGYFRAENEFSPPDQQSDFEDRPNAPAKEQKKWRTAGGHHFS